MPTSNRIILTDVDGVLLEWEHHFTKWMLQRTLFDERGARYHPYRLLPNKENTYEMAERFGLTKSEIRKEIREFNKSAWMGNQAPMPNSQTWVKLLESSDRGPALLNHRPSHPQLGKFLFFLGP